MKTKERDEFGDEVAWISLIEEEVMRSGHKEEPDRTEQNQTEQSRKGG